MFPDRLLDSVVNLVRTLTGNFAGSGYYVGKVYLEVLGSAYALSVL
jgi:hypothetical protein